MWNQAGHPEILPPRSTKKPLFSQQGIDDKQIVFGPTVIGLVGMRLVCAEMELKKRHTPFPREEACCRLKAEVKIYGLR